MNLRVLKITIPYLCNTINLMKVADWIVGIHFRREFNLDVYINIPVGLCVMGVSLSGNLRVRRFVRVFPKIIRVLNHLLYQGVRVRSFTYRTHRWVRNHVLLVQRLVARLPIVEETDFEEI